MLGDPDVPHTYTFIDDFASALVTLGHKDEALGQVWHVPNAEAVTTRRLVEMVFAQFGLPARLGRVPTIAITLLALFNPAIAAVKETLYQSERPWVVDHGKFMRAFGGQPTGLQQAIEQTVAWFKSSGPGAG